MKCFLLTFALVSVAYGDKLNEFINHENNHVDHEQHAIHEQHANHGQHNDHHHDTATPAPAQTLTQHHAAAAQTISQPLAPSQTYSQPLAPAAEVNSYSDRPDSQSYYYYYYPEVPNAPKEKDLWTKIKDLLAPLLFSSRSDVKDPYTMTTIIIVSVVAVGLIVFGPTLIGLLGLTSKLSKVLVFLEKIISASSDNARGIELNTDDLMFYATTVLKAINKEY